MPAFINFIGIVKEIVESDRSISTFTCQVNLGNQIGIVTVTAFITANVVDNVIAEDVVQILGTYILEESNMKVRASQVTAIREGDVAIRPANVILIGEAEMGKINVEQYFEKQVRKFEIGFVANEAATKSVLKYLRKGKLAVFVGSIVQQDRCAVHINEIQLLHQNSPSSPTSNELLNKNAVGSNKGGDEESSKRRTSKRNISFALNEGSAGNSMGEKKHQA